MRSDGVRQDARLTLPNVLTGLRLVMAPVFLGLHLTGRTDAALAVYAAAAATDVSDGLIARLFKQGSKLGAILDPIADKVLVFAALGALTLERRLPVWLIGLVIFRDGLMVLGAALVRHKRLELPTSPSRVGKYATFTLFCLVLLALVGESSYAPDGLRGYTVAVGFVAALCIVISTLQYYARFGYLFFAPPRS
jgi:cardiolipin synthase